MIFLHIPKTGGSAIIDRLKVNHSKHIPMKFCEKRKGWWTVVRNPFDRLISMYAYTNNYVIDENPDKVKKWFSDQIKNPMPVNEFANLITPMCEYIDFSQDVEVLRFENLQDEIKKRYDVDLPVVNFSRRGNYEYYYDEELREIVLDYYREDFKLFNYKV